MATITITEILGGDNIAASRVVINNNFTLLQNAVNTLETRLNTSYVPGGALNVGDVQVLKYTRAASVVTFLNQGSAQIDGNLSLGTATNSSTLTVTGNADITANLDADGDVTFNNTAGTAGTNVLTNYLQNIENDSYAHEQLYGVTTKSPLLNVQTLTGVLSNDIDVNTRYVHLDVSTVTAPNNILVLPLPSALNDGQIITLLFDSVAPTNLQFEINNSAGFAPAFSNTTLAANIILNDNINSTTAKFRGIWIDLAVTSNGWIVIGAHGDVTYF